MVKRKFYKGIFTTRNGQFLHYLNRPFLGIDSIILLGNLWDSLKYVRVPNKTTGINARRLNSTMKLEPKLTLESFKSCSTLADIILKKTVKPSQKYAINSINQYHRHFIPSIAFRLRSTTDISIKKFLRAEALLKLQV